jgi:chitin-binding protein
MAEHRITNAWQGGYQAEVTVMNHGTTPLNGWRVQWTIPNGQSINSVWNGALTTTGSQAVVRNADWNPTVAPDGTTTFGLSANAPAGAPAQPTLTCSSP